MKAPDNTLLGTPTGRQTGKEHDGRERETNIVDIGIFYLFQRKKGEKKHTPSQVTCNFDQLTPLTI